MHHRLFTILFVLAVNHSTAAQEITLHKDIEFAKPNNHSLRLDLARPADNNTYPAIVFIHGGGWQFGDRKIYLDEAQQAARHGFVGVTVSYRLTDPDQQGRARNPFPAQIEDVRCAIRWLRAHAEKYHLDPNRIGVTGKSAGGHLSLLLGTAESAHGIEAEDCYPEVSARVQAVVNCFGPTELASLHADSPKAGKLIETLLGGTPATLADKYRSASPINYVSPDDPPTLTIHGSNDRLVPVSQAKKFHQAMQEAGANHTLLIIPNAAHGFQGPAAKQRDQDRFDFFKTIFK